MKYEPKHLREGESNKTDQEQPCGSVPDGITGTPEGLPTDPDGADQDTRVHPLGIPIPDPGDGGEYVPIPGRGCVEQIAPNGAVIRNPWSEQPEIKPDNAYTEEQQDQNLLIM